MKGNFLEYHKTILEKVSFDGRLMRKEYRKAKIMLKEEEISELRMWLRNSGLVKHLQPSQSNQVFTGV